MPHTIEGTLHDVATAPEGYVAALGTLTFDTSKLPKTNWNRQDQTPPLTHGGYTLGIGPCGGHAFFNPPRDALQKTQTCYIKGRCPKPIR